MQLYIFDIDATASLRQTQQYRHRGKGSKCQIFIGITQLDQGDSESKPNLQLIPAHNLLLHLAQLQHIPRARNIPPPQPLPPLRNQEDDRVRRERRLVDQLVVEERRHREADIGRDGSRVDPIRHHTLSAVLDVQILGVAQEREFADLVARAAGGGHESPDAGEHDDLLVAAFEHQGQQRPREQVRAADVHGPGLPPLLGIAVEGGFELFHRSRVVDQDVQFAEGVGCFLGCTLYALSVEDVEAYWFDLG